MVRKPTPPPQPDDPEEYRRFVETAREVEADERPGATDRALGKIIGPKRPEKDKSRHE